MDQVQATNMVEQYGDMVFRYALAITKQRDIADDVFQDVFLRYVKKQPTFENDEHAKAWFLVVCKNCCRNYFMSAFVRHTTSLTQDFPIINDSDCGLYYEVMKLPRKYRTIIHLYYYEAYSTKMIASLLHKKDATIRTQLRRARQQLKDQLEGCDKIENL